jgi:hypothetical protein
VSEAVVRSASRFLAFKCAVDAEDGVRVRHCGVAVWKR